MGKYMRIALAVLLVVFIPVFAGAGQALIPVDHYPPWKIADQEEISGIDIELVTVLLSEIDHTPVFESYPWIRCIKMMETGDADILTGVLKRPEREEDMHFIEPPYKTKSCKALYILKESEDIATYEELRGKVIGAKRGVKFFKRFDEDPSIQIEEIHTDELNFMKLVAGRIDAVIVTESIGDYLLAKSGLGQKIKKASFRYDKEVPVYFAVSKKSPLMSRVHELEDAARQLKQSGRFDQIIHHYFDSLAKHPH